MKSRPAAVPRRPPEIDPYDPATIPTLNGAKDRAFAALRDGLFGHRDPTAGPLTDSELAEAFAAATLHIQNEIEAAAVALPLVEQAARDAENWLTTYSLPMRIKAIVHDDITH